ncbi:hypothetical protein J7K74_01130 [Candidatus Woesearchaeota archaeon]|nr:hypothetical protein [Candidatus Woesearchaeota archaeon]
MDEYLSLEQIYKELETLDKWEYNIDQNNMQLALSYVDKEEALKILDLLLDTTRGEGRIIIQNNTILLILGEGGITKKHINIARNINNLLNRD